MLYLVIPYYLREKRSRLRQNIELSTTCQVVWICGILHDMGVMFHQPTTLYYENKAVIFVVANPMYHESSKHIEIDRHLVQEKIKMGFIQTAYIPTSEKLANIFTKS